MLNANRAKAFNVGSDARLKGLSLSDNPYLPGSPQSVSWKAGWKDADKHWGTRARGPIKALPQVHDYSVN